MTARCFASQHFPLLVILVGCSLATSPFTDFLLVLLFIFNFSNKNVVIVCNGVDFGWLLVD